MRRASSFASLPLCALAALLASASCAESVTPVDPTTAAATGAGTTTATTGSGSGGTGGEGATGPCHTQADCAHLDGACTVGTCINGECEASPANDGSGCDDGKQCSVGDVCQAGECVGASTKPCPASAPCMVGSCDLETDACIEVPGQDGAGCVDDDPCTLTSVCSAGTCVGGQPVDCSFLDGICSVGSCDPQLGCVAEPKNDGDPCEDGFFCTVGDSCQGGICGGDPNPCVAPGETCLVASCDENADTCVAVPGNEGGSCDDGSACTSGETCSNGTCGGGAPANQGGPCDDGSACSTGDVCSSGVCSGTPVLACANGDGCCPGGCTIEVDDDCQLLDVGVANGLFYTDGLRAHLAAQPMIKSATTFDGCDPGTLAQFDVIVLYGNMSCFDPGSFDAFTSNGGGLVGTPWIHNNNGGLPSLPVTGVGSGSAYSQPMSVQVTDPADVLLQGVAFQNGDLIGFENFGFVLKAGASAPAIHENLPTQYAVARWEFGSGRSVFLNFHYITSDCALAIDHPWGKQLAYNAVLWAGKVVD